MSALFTIFSKYWKQIAVSLLILVYIAINIFRIGGDAFVIELNNYIILPLALGLTALGIVIFRQLESGSQNQLLWLGLAIGWAQWTIAEIWWAIASSIGQEVPYPSWADFFWTVGYLPMYYALWARLRSLPKISNPAQRAGIWVLSLAFSALTILFVILPIIRESDPSAMLESLLNILYPLEDLALAVLVLWLLFTYQQGMYGQAWRWLAVGFIVLALGDLIFSYVDTLGLYYPEQQGNLLSTIGVDVPYNLSYLIMMVGVFRMQRLLDVFRPAAVGDGKLALVPNTHLLVSTKGDRTVIDVSRNHARVYSGGPVKGKAVSQVIGISLEDERIILEELKTKGILTERPFTANTRFGQKEILISGIVVLYPQQVLSGVMLLVRLLVEEDHSLDELLSDYEKGLVLSMLGRTGTDQKELAEIKRLLRDYYQAYVTAFYNRAIPEGGSIMADAFIAELQLAAKRAGWQVKIQSNATMDVSHLHLPEVRKELPLLFETGRQFIGNLTGEATANAMVQDVRSKFSELALKNISHFESVERKPN